MVDWWHERISDHAHGVEDTRRPCSTGAARGLGGDWVWRAAVGDPTGPGEVGSGTPSFLVLNAYPIRYPQQLAVDLVLQRI